MRKIVEVVEGPSIRSLQEELEQEEAQRSAFAIRLQNLGGRQYTNRMILAEIRSIDDILPGCYWVVYRRRNDDAVFSGVVSDKTWMGWLAPGSLYKNNSLWLLGLERDIEKLCMAADLDTLQDILNCEVTKLGQALVKTGELGRLGEDGSTTKILKRMAVLVRRLRSLGFDAADISTERQRLLAALAASS